MSDYLAFNSGSRPETGQGLIGESSSAQLVDLIRSGIGPWQNRSIEFQDRKTLERLARLALRSRGQIDVRGAVTGTGWGRDVQS